MKHITCTTKHRKTPQRNFYNPTLHALITLDAKGYKVTKLLWKCRYCGKYTKRFRGWEMRDCCPNCLQERAKSPFEIHLCQVLNLRRKKGGSNDKLY